MQITQTDYRRNRKLERTHNEQRNFINNDNNNNNIPTKKSSGLHSFTGDIYQMFKEELTLIFHKHFQKIKEMGALPN